MSMDNKIEELAKDLRIMVYLDKPKDETLEQASIRLAKHVLRREISARLEENYAVVIKEKPAILVPEGIAFKNRIDELNQQLKELDGV